MFAFMAGMSVISATDVNKVDVTANLLGKFYGIAGFTFLVLTTTFAIIAGMTIWAVKNTYKHLY